MTHEKQNCSLKLVHFKNQQEPFADCLYGVDVGYACSRRRGPGRCRWIWQIVTFPPSIAVGMLLAGLAPGSKELLASSQFQAITSNLPIDAIQTWLARILIVIFLQVNKIEKDCLLCPIVPFLLLFSYCFVLCLGNVFRSLVYLGCSYGVDTVSQPS